MPTQVTNDARADAKHQEEVISQYRDYCTYLRSQLVLLSSQAQQPTIAFEDAERVNNEAAEAQKAIATIAPPRRQLFATIVEQERQEQQRLFEIESRKKKGEHNRLPDPDVVTQAALVTLLEEAEGRSTNDGRGLVPRGKPDDIKWYSIDITTIGGAPDAAAYSTGRSEQQDRKRIFQQVGLGLLLIAGTIIWIFIPKGSGTPQVQASSAQSNGVSIHPWAIESLEIAQTTGQIATIPVSSTTALSWPKLPKDAAFGYWQTTSYQPLVVCVPAAKIGTITTIRALSDGTGPDRVYTVVAGSQSGDMEIQACDSDTDPTYASLVETQEAAVEEIATTIDTPVTAITVQEITMIGPGSDPLLPPDQAQVSVHTQTVEAMPWTDARPTLTLQDGTMLTTSNIVKTEQGSELQYLVPLPTEPIDLMWSMQLETMRQPLRWRTRFDPPPARDMVLRDAVEVKNVQAVQGEDENTVTISLTVINRSEEPLLLTSDDFALTANDQALAKPDLASLRDPLQGREQRRISLRAPLSGEQRLTLTVGVVRYQIIPTK